MQPRRGLRTVMTILSRLTVAVVVMGPSLFGLASARASMVLALDLADLVQRAERIALVDVISVQANWDSRHERILSTIQLRVAEDWKRGSAAGTSPVAGQTDIVTVVQEGGSVDGLTMTVFGMTKFSPGERSVVFLRGRADRAQVVGMAQGKRPVHLDPQSRQWMVLPPNLSGIKLVQPPAAGGNPRRDVVRQAIGLGDFRDQVKRLMNEPAAP